MATPDRDPRLVASMLVLAVCALGAAYAALVAERSSLAQVHAYIHVRWAEDIAESQRRQLEQRFSLTEGLPKEGTTASFGYRLTDTSSDNIRALVNHAAVADTHEIDRSAFTLSPSAPRIISPGSRTEWLAPLLRRAALVFVIVGAGLLVLVVAAWFAPAVMRLILRNIRSTIAATPRVTVRWIASRVPDGTPEAVAVSRVVFGVALVAFLIWDSPGEIWLTAWLLVWGLLFSVGALSRVAFAALTAGTFAWVDISGVSAHPVSGLLVTLVCLLPSSWGDAWSVDAWWRRRRGAPAPMRSPREYGYTVWIPAFVVGVLFAAAAMAKLRASGLDWITNGTVKYHFLTDSYQAPLDWGLRLGSSDAVAVLLSLAAVIIEACVLPLVLLGRYRWRAIAGAASASILVGFYLFQGIFWPGWWLLLVGFLPWHLVRRPARLPAPAAGGVGLPPLYVALIVALVAQQVVASAFRLEVWPLFSEYGMYATTYMSHEDYEEKTTRSRWLVAELDDGTTARCEMPSSEAQAAAEAIMHGAGIEPFLDRCVGGGARARNVRVEALQMAVDWDRWRLLEERLVTLAGPLRLDAEGTAP